MNAREFHATELDDKVVVCIGTSEHVAKVLDKQIRPNKFLLRFHLANGDARDQWRRPCSCQRADRTQPMGPTRRHENYRTELRRKAAK